MEVSQHAIDRAVERLGLSPADAPRVLIFIYEHGHAPFGKEWETYGVLPHFDLVYRCHAQRMVIANPFQNDGVIVTVVTPYFPGVWKHPNLKALRGMSVREALWRYRQNT